MDAAHSAMITAIRSDSVPNLFVLNYDALWRVRNLLLVPSFFFAESCVVARPPLSPNARRAGWIGCEIHLNRIAPEGKLWVVRESSVVSPSEVRRQYETIRPLSQVAASARGWTLDVLNALHKIGRQEFTLDEAYAFEAELAVLHPNNNNVRPKIRQQLQVLRDAGLLEFVAPGKYRSDDLRSAYAHGRDSPPATRLAHVALRGSPSRRSRRRRVRRGRVLLAF